MEKALLLIGDSNVNRSFYRVGPLYSQMTDFVQVRNLAELAPALTTVKSSHKYVVLSCLTNIIVDAGTISQTGDRDTSILNDLNCAMVETKGQIRAPIFYRPAYA